VRNIGLRQKFDKKVLRKQYADGDLDVQTLDSAPEKA